MEVAEPVVLDKQQPVDLSVSLCIQPGISSLSADLSREQLQLSSCQEGKILYKSNSVFCIICNNGIVIL